MSAFMHCCCWSFHLHQQQLARQINHIANASAITQQLFNDVAYFNPTTTTAAAAAMIASQSHHHHQQQQISAAQHNGTTTTTTSSINGGAPTGGTTATTTATNNQSNQNSHQQQQQHHLQHQIQQHLGQATNHQLQPQQQQQQQQQNHHHQHHQPHHSHHLSQQQPSQQQQQQQPQHNSSNVSSSNNVNHNSTTTNMNNNGASNTNHQHHHQQTQPHSTSLSNNVNNSVGRVRSHHQHHHHAYHHQTQQQPSHHHHHALLSYQGHNLASGASQRSSPYPLSSSGQHRSSRHRVHALREAQTASTYHNPYINNNNNNSNNNNHHHQTTQHQTHHNNPANTTNTNASTNTSNSNINTDANISLNGGSSISNVVNNGASSYLSVPLAAHQHDFNNLHSRLDINNRLPNLHQPPPQAPPAQTNRHVQQLNPGNNGNNISTLNIDNSSSATTPYHSTNFNLHHQRQHPSHNVLASSLANTSQPPSHNNLSPNRITEIAAAAMAMAPHFNNPHQMLASPELMQQLNAFLAQNLSNQANFTQQAAETVMAQQEVGDGDNYDMLSMSERLGESKPRGLTKPEIEQLLSYTLEEVNEKDPSACVICMCDFEVKSKIRTLSCSHEFHAKCVDKWLKANRTCPICRRDASRAQVESSSDKRSRHH